MDAAKELAVIHGLAVLAVTLVPLLVRRLSLSALELLSAVCAVLLGVHALGNVFTFRAVVSALAFRTPADSGLNGVAIASVVAGLALGFAGAWFAVPALAGADGADAADSDPETEPGAAPDSAVAVEAAVGEAVVASAPVRWRATEVLGDADERSEHDERERENVAADGERADDEIRVRLPIARRQLLFVVVVLGLSISELTGADVSRRPPVDASAYSMLAVACAGLLLGAAALASLLDAEADGRDAGFAAAGLGLLGVAGAVPHFLLVEDDLVFQFGAAASAGLLLPVGAVAVVRLLRDVGVRTRVVAAGVVLVLLSLVSAVGGYAAARSFTDSFRSGRLGWGLEFPMDLSAR